jgi:hypothetical protein
VVWKVKEEEEWKSEKYHLEKEKGVFDAECYTISEVVRMAAVSSDREELKKVTIFPKFITATKRVQHTRPGPGERIAIQTVEHNHTLFARGIQVVYSWVPSHDRVEENKKADEKVKDTALGEEEGVKAIAEMYKGTSLAKIQREITTAKWSETEQRWEAKLSKKTVTAREGWVG